ncbi:MAG: copper amine oxidase N-terminal domain-containing protein [Armatimonadota bacterium]
MRALTVIAAILTVLSVTASFAVAGTLSVEGAGNLSLNITCDLPPTDAETPEVAGPITVAPVSEEICDRPLVIYIDGKVAGLTSSTAGRFDIDSDALGEGEHTLRVDAVEGEQLLASTGSVPFTVVGAAKAAERQAQAPPDLGGNKPPFIKLYRPRIFREIVYFNNREADLEKHAFVRNGRVYITLTDLMRHIGGSIIWGPEPDEMMVYRNGVEVRVYPHSATVWVNGVETSLGYTTLRKQNRTYVPVRPFTELFGIATEWDFQDDRAYVVYQEQAP